jgi:uncharacterized protein YndB with AHSA1/START domain
VIEPIRIAFRVDAALDVAWSVWTERFGQWWPADHTATGRDDLEVVLERRVGGRIYERTPDGEEHDWGEVTAWEPPRRLAYTWHLRRDRADATDVEIRFSGLDGGTHVEIEHRGWERLGADGESWRDRNRGGWSTLLPHYLEAAGGGTEIEIRIGGVG